MTGKATQSPLLIVLPDATSPSSFVFPPLTDAVVGKTLVIASVVGSVVTFEYATASVGSAAIGSAVIGSTFIVG